LWVGISKNNEKTIVRRRSAVHGRPWLGHEEWHREGGRLDGSQKPEIHPKSLQEFEQKKKKIEGARGDRFLIPPYAKLNIHRPLSLPTPEMLCLLFEHLLETQEAFTCLPLSPLLSGPLFSFIKNMLFWRSP